MHPPVGTELSYRSSRIYYYSWGSGPRLLFAFHGYGESAASFAFLGAALDPAFTLVAIDLPFHGRTDWREGSVLYPEQLCSIMESIAGMLGRDGGPPPPPSWTLLGYSMGGRIALQLFEDNPDRFDRLVLAAPDGMTVNPWYWLATATAAGSGVFRWSMRHPGWLFFALRCGHALRLVNPSIYKFADHYIDDRQVRQELYTRWMAMRRFSPRLSRIAALVRSRRTPVRLIYGKFDRIIRWERGEKFRVRCPDDCRLLVVDAGHQLLRSQYLPVILPLLG